MYKTIRHGENSLQYTILPQNDDFRTNPIDSEIVTHERRIRSKFQRTKSSILAYIGLFFVCSVVTGAIVVPLLVSRDIMPSPLKLFNKDDELGKNLKSGKSVASKPTYHPQVITLRRNNTDLSKITTTASSTTTKISTISAINDSSDESLSTTTIPATSAQNMMDLPTSIDTTKVVIETDLNDAAGEIILNNKINYNYENLKKSTDDLKSTTGSLITLITTLATTAITLNDTTEKIIVTTEKSKNLKILKPYTINTTKTNDSVDAKNNWFKTHLPFFEFSTYLWAVSD